MRKAMSTLKSVDRESIHDFIHSVKTDPRTSLIKRDFASLRYEKSLVFALLVQLVIAGFSSFLVVGFASMYETGAGTTTTIGVVGESANEFKSASSMEDGLIYTMYPDREDAISDMESGNIDGVVVLNEKDTGRIMARIIVPKGKLKTTLAVNQISQTLERLEMVKRIEMQERLKQNVLPVPVDADPNTYFTFTYTMLVPLLIFVPVFLTGSIIIDTLSEELAEGTFELLHVSPLTFEDILTAKTTTAILLGLGQIALWFVLLSLNGTAVKSPLMLMLIGFGMTLTIATLALVIVLLKPDRKYAQFIYSFAALAVGGIGLGLPQHPVNTIARFAVGSPNLLSYGMVLAYLGVGVGVFYGFHRLLELNLLSPPTTE